MSQITMEQAMQMAAEHFRCRRLGQAEALCRQILGAQPNHPDGLHMLGLIAGQTGRTDLAMDLFRRAIAAAPDNPTYHCNLGVILRKQGQLDQGIACYQRALALKPDYADAHYNLGNALRDKRNLDQAIACYQQALAHKPDFSGAYANLAAAWMDKGELDQAIACCREAIALQPDYAEVHNMLGNALWKSGQSDQAIASYQRALEVNPDYAEACSNLGNALTDKGQLDQAIALCQRALQIKPDYGEAHNNLGNALLKKKQPDQAIACYERAMQLMPGQAQICINLGAARMDKRQVDQAIGCYRRALEINPNYAEAHYNLGTAWMEKGHPDEAIASLQRALALKPGYADAHNNLGNALKEAGRVEQAIACYVRALALSPDNAVWHSNLVYAMHFLEGCDAAALLAANRRWARQHADPVRHLIGQHDNDRDPERCLRVGYVSAHFYDHAEAFFVVPLLENHDRGQVEIHGYASVAHPDAITERIRRSAGAWHDVRGWSDAEVAEQIRRDRIDILVDLTMHMSDNRALLFARKPAPVQVAWLAYPGGTGMEAMDYRLTDAFIDPAENDKAYVEESLRLPDCWCCYDPLSDQAAVGPRGQRPICFASLNNPCKLNEPLLRLWGEVMRRVVDSRLLIQAISGTHRREIARLYQGLGIASDRLEFVGRCGRGEYLRLYDRIDICLDPLPYNGITTTCDALWMGVPVVSLRGRTAAGRVGGSILSNIGLAELVGDVAEDFVAIAAELANDVPRLNLLRATLRDRMSRSPLMDGKRFARGVESAYRRMWRQWCQAPAG